MSYLFTRLPVVSAKATISIDESKAEPIYLETFNSNYATWDFVGESSLTSRGRNTLQLTSFGEAPSFTENGLTQLRNETVYQQLPILDTDFDKLTIFGALKTNLLDYSIAGGYAGLVGNWRSGTIPSGVLLSMRSDNKLECAANGAGQNALLSDVMDGGWIFYAFSYDKTAGKVTRLIRQESTGIALSSTINTYIPSPVKWGLGAFSGPAGKDRTDMVNHAFCSVDDSYKDLTELEGIYANLKAYMRSTGLVI